MSGFRIVEHKVPAQHIRDFPHATAETQEDQLYLHAKQYIPLSNPNPRPGDVTFIAAHANGFPKELYEPLFEDLLVQSELQGWRIRGIWIADLAHQGHSSVLNERLLGNDPGWDDHSRDLLHMINVKRDEMPRPLIGMGHSVGGCQLTLLSLMHPRLFTSLILIDPVIQEKSAEVDPSPNAPPNLAQMSTFRRDVWPSREQAAASFAKSGQMKVWDPRVLDRWVKFGLRDGPTLLKPYLKAPQVTLTCTPSQEVLTFLRPNYEGYGVNGKPVDRDTHPDLDASRKHVAPFYRGEPPKIYDRLPEVRPTVLYVFGSTSVVSGSDSNARKVARTGVGLGGSGGVALGRVKGVTLEGVGHLIPMEDSKRTAVEVAGWVSHEVKKYREEMKAWEAWRKKSLAEKQEVDEAWKRNIGGPLKRPAKI